MGKLNRGFDLLLSKGLSGLARGIRDWAFYSSLSTYLVPFWDERVLCINQTQIKFGIYDRESFRRSLGHGEESVLSDFVSELKKR